MGSDPCPYYIIERLVDLILEKRSSTTYIFFWLYFFCWLPRIDISGAG